MGRYAICKFVNCPLTNNSWKNQDGGKSLSGRRRELKKEAETESFDWITSGQLRSGLAAHNGPISEMA
jgi:hypothetical protein